MCFIKRERVFRREPPGLREERNEAECFPSGCPHNLRHAGCEQREVAAELVHHESADQRRVRAVDHGFGADQTRDHSAAVDIADQYDCRFGCAGKAHIGNVARAQIHL